MIFLHASLRGPRPPNGKRGTIFRRALNSKNDMTGASRKIWILIYPHPSDAREPQKNTPFPFFLFRRQRVSKGNFIFNREYSSYSVGFFSRTERLRPLLPFSRISPAAKTAGAQNAPRPVWMCFGCVLRLAALRAGLRPKTLPGQRRAEIQPQSPVRRASHC